MLRNAFTPLRSLIIEPLLARTNRSAGGPEQRPTEPAAWRVDADSIVDPAGRRVPLARHGLDRYAAMRALKTATVLHGDFPHVTELARDSDEVANLVSQVSTTGELFTAYASLYRNTNRTILLLDYLR